MAFLQFRSDAAWAGVDEGDGTAELGSSVHVDAESGKVNSHQLYYKQSGQNSLARGEWGTLHWGFRAVWNTEKPANGGERYLVDVRELRVDRSLGNLEVRLGLQNVTWGETFGLSVVDLVNPRDLSASIYEDVTEAKLPVGMVNLLGVAGPVHVQVIAVPYPRGPRLPTSVRLPQGNVLGVSGHAEEFSPLKDGEVSTKIGVLFPFGLDVSLLHLNVWNRNPVWTPEVVAGELRLQEERARVQSTGVTFSQSFESIVLRGDAIYHRNYFALSGNRREARRYHLLQTVMGGDFTTVGGSTVGIQWHRDAWNQSPLPLPPHVNVTGTSPEPYQVQQEQTTFHWAGARLRLPWFDSQFTTEAMVFHGIGNGDKWVKAEAGWNMTSHLSAALVGNWISSSGDSGQILFSEAQDIGFKLSCVW